MDYLTISLDDLSYLMMKITKYELFLPFMILELIRLRIILLLPASSRVSANVADVAFTSGIDSVGAFKNAAIGVEPLGKISN